MARIDDLLIAGIKGLGPRPSDEAPQGEKNPWVSKLSNVIAGAFGEELRLRGMLEARPAGPGEVGLSGVERRLAGGIGAKKVDVTWATEESGLLFAASIKTIMYRDKQSRNYQKNLTNRRADMLFEAITLHRRFPYAVLSGWLFLDVGAASDGTDRRKSTLQNVFPRFRLFTGRDDPAGREEQFERLFVLLLDANKFQPSVTCYEVNNSVAPIEINEALTELTTLTAIRNFDTYDANNGKIYKIRPGGDID
ncbi:hypothetical protein [Actinoplanes sp. NPDC049265]|uniref:hypothetical protein n=1 Tax=Actinoplanes sp. NPDC049265 TaxID=3363902 RepID=UPI0037200FED